TATRVRRCCRGVKAVRRGRNHRGLTERSMQVACRAARQIGALCGAKSPVMATRTPENRAGWIPGFRTDRPVPSLSRRLHPSRPQDALCGGDLYGDGVNIAARLQAMAEPSEIYVSQIVRDHVKNKVQLKFEHLGEQTVKNITEPVGVF